MINKSSIITITSSAWKKMANIVKAKQAEGFIFSAVSGGCNGLNYNLKLFNNSKELDEIVTGKLKATKIENENLSVYIDPLSEMFLLENLINNSQSPSFSILNKLK